MRGDMHTPNSRLKSAREKLFDSAADAAKALGVPYGTYVGHENGHRGFPAARAPQYARKFKVTEEWLLYGKGDAAFEPVPSVDTLTAMVRDVLSEVLTTETKISDLPRIVGPALHEQLEQYQAGGRVMSFEDAQNDRDARVQSPAPTRQDERAG